MSIERNILRDITSETISDLDSARKKAYEWCDSNGWVWPREQQFLHVVEETGELVDEILVRKNGDLIDLSHEVDELWDLWFTYLTFIDNQDFKLDNSEKFSVYKYVIQRTKWIDWNNIEKDILLRFVTEVSRENKVQRKLSGRKDNYKYSQLDVKKSQALSLFYLYILTKTYWSSVSQLVDNSIEKYEGRDKK